LIADKSSGEVVELVAIAKAAPRRAGEGGAATLEGRSGMVEGVNAGALRGGASAPARSMTPDGGIDEVAATGPVGTAGGIAAGAPLAVCFFVAFSDLCVLSALRAGSPGFSARVVSLSAEGCGGDFAACPDLSGASALCASRDLSDQAAGFAGLSDLSGVFSDLRSGFAALSGFCADCAGAGAVASDAGAACAAAAQQPNAASVTHVSRKAFTDTDLSAGARRLHPSSTRKIEEKLKPAPLQSTIFAAKTGHRALRAVPIRRRLL